MPYIFVDTETYSEVPIKDGLYRYGENAEVMIVTWATEDSPVYAWDRTAGANEPAELRALVDDPTMIFVAHNAPFDRFMLDKIGLHIPLERWRCNMARALAHGLPGKLELLGEIFNLSEGEAKLKSGRALMMLFCKPRPKSMALRRATRRTHPVEWQGFLDYAGNDIVSMRLIWSKLPEWNYKGFELELWWLDQKINARGIYVDLDLANAAIRATDRAKAILKDRTGELTNDRLVSTTQRDATLAYILAEHGIDLPDMQKSTIERRLNDPDLPDELRELLAIRLQATTTSTAKYGALLRSVAADGRLHGTMQFCGASRSGRDGHRLFQPGNLPRPTMKNVDIAAGIEAMKADCEDLLFDNVMKLTSNAIRGCITAPPGKKLIIADLANIEGRVLAWLACEETELEVFRKYDTIVGVDEKGRPIRAGHDVYRVSYANAFGISPDEVDDRQRQIGKVYALFLGYNGGVGAFITGAATYGIDLEAMAVTARPSIPDDVWGEAEGFMNWLQRPAWKKHTKRMDAGVDVAQSFSIYEDETLAVRFGLSSFVFCVCDSLKRLWRRAHPETVAFWKETEDAARNAIQNPGVTFDARRLKFRRDGQWLRMRLPSGRAVCYVSPQVDDKGAISYMGVNQYTRKWDRMKTYSGRLVENACQATARDFFFHPMPAIEAHGYEVVLRVHDEYVTETVDGAVEELSRLMATPPPWAPGIPLAAAGFETQRYAKH